MNAGRLARLSILVGASITMISASTLGQEHFGPPEAAGSYADDHAAEAEVSPARAAPERTLPEITSGPSMTLAEALDRAAKRNLSLVAAQLEIDKARAQLKQAWGLVLPVIQGESRFQHMDHQDTLDLMAFLAPMLDAMGITLSPDTTSQPILLSPQDKLTASIQVAMPIIDAKSWLTIRASRKGVEVAELSVEDGERQLLLGVAQAYYMALMARELIDLYSAQVDAAEIQLSVARARLDAETGLRIDVVRAETDAEKTYQDLVAANLAFDNTRDALASLTNSDGLPLPEPAPSLRSPEESEKGMEEHARAARTDLRASRAKVDLQDRLLDAAWMQFLPSLSAAWQGSYQFTEMGDMGSQDRSRWAVMLTLTVPIYNQFRYGDIDYKRAAVRQSVTELEDLERKSSLAVRTAARGYRSALLSMEIAERQVALAREGLTLSEAAYKAGTSTSLEVTEARRAFTSAGVNLATERLRSQIALLSLIDELGDNLVASAIAEIQGAIIARSGYTRGLKRGFRDD
jgi:outer membrane protein TolC